MQMQYSLYISRSHGRSVRLGGAGSWLSWKGTN